MILDEALSYCLSKPGAWRDEPWDDDVVAKVGAKIFAFTGQSAAIGLKCGDSREEADMWLSRYPEDASVMSYIGRHGWNSLRLDGAIPDEEIRGAIDDSYLAVAAKLPKSKRPRGWDD